MLKHIALITFSVGLGVAAVACGGDDDGDDTSSGGSGGTPGGSGGETTTGGSSSTGGSSAGGSGGGGAVITDCADADDPTMCNDCLTQAEGFGTTVDDLVTCSCAYCATELDACYNLADSAEAEKCRNVVDCGRAAGCKGTECYCGVGVSVADCLANGPTGECVDEIAIAADCQDITDLVDQAVCVQQARDADGSTLNLASAVGACSTGDPGLTPPAPGACGSL